MGQKVVDWLRFRKTLRGVGGKAGSVEKRTGQKAGYRLCSRRRG
jgi:hypothetical protein